MCVLKRSTPLQKRAPKNPASLLRSWVQDSTFQLWLTNCSVCYGRRAPFLCFDTSEHISLALPAPIIIHFPLPKPLSRKYEILCLDCPLRSPSSLPKPGAERFVPFALPAPCHPSDIAETWFRNLHIIPFACSPPSRRPHRTQDSKCYKMDT